MVKAEPKKAEGSGLPLGHKGKYVLMPLLYPHDFPKEQPPPADRGVPGNFWHLMQMEVIPAREEAVKKSSNPALRLKPEASTLQKTGQQQVD